MPAALKRKITVSLDSELVNRIDEFASRSRQETRSSVIEGALRVWEKSRQRLALESATEEYYKSTTARERNEDRSWARLSLNQFARRRE